MTRIKRLVKMILGLDPWIWTQINLPTLHFGEEEYDWIFCPLGISQDSIVYSFGIGENISFDLQLIEKFGLNVFAFDPTPKSVLWIEAQNLPPKFVFYPLGLSDIDGTMGFYQSHDESSVSFSEINMKGNGYAAKDPVQLEVRKLLTLCRMLKHDHIDILKLDIEGSEYTAILDFLKDQVSVDQILVEFHHRFYQIKKSQTLEIINALNHYGYKIFSISDSGSEYSFIKIDRFKKDID